MGTGVALMVSARLTAGLLLVAILAGCGSEKRQSRPLVATVGVMAVSTVAAMRDRRSGTAPKAAAVPTRADIEKAGVPVLRASIARRGFDSFLTILDSRDDVVTWKTRDGTTFALRDGVLIQTRGLGPDLMSSTVPSVAQLSQDGGTHTRQYFFLGPNDQPTRRTYDCTVAIVGTEEIVIFERTHEVTHTTETCVRGQSGKISNDFWIEEGAVRKSRQWASALTGYVEFERVVD
jgi:hypothetical protein